MTSGTKWLFACGLIVVGMAGLTFAPAHAEGDPLWTPEFFAPEFPPFPHELASDEDWRPTAPRRTTAPLPPEALRRGGYQSVQVNVDADGNNILDDAANEPTIAIAPDDPSKIVIGWRQFDWIGTNFRQAGWAHSHDAGHTWTFPGVLQAGVFRSDPVLAADTNGTFFFYSLAAGPPFYCQMFKSIDGGVSWAGPISAFGGDKAWVDIDCTGGIGDGNIYAAWDYAGCCDDDWFTRSTDGGLTYMDPIVIPGWPYWGTVAVAPDGEVFVIGGDGDGSSLFYCVRSSNAQDPAVTPTFDQLTQVNFGGRMRYYVWSSPNPGGLLGEVWVACDHSDGPTRGNVYALCSVDPPGGDPLDVMFARSTDGGATFSAPIRVNDDAPGTNAWQWFGTLDVAPNGRIDVIWYDTRNGTDYRWSEVFYSYSTDGGLTFSPNVPVTPAFDSHLGWPSQEKLGDYCHLISDSAGANLAYAATFNGEQDVYFLRLGDRDCNANGAADELDVGTGASADCNENLVPDECEPGGTEDCNDNTIIDLCDIYAGTSPDCNYNGSPDECDIASGSSADCDLDGVPDECALADGTALDCNNNGIPDSCDIAGGESDDCQPNGIPDECEIAPARDDCAAAIIVCPEYTYYGSTAGATCDGASQCTTSDNTPDVWYYYEPFGSGILTISLCGSFYDTVVSVHTGCPGTAENEIGCNDDHCLQQSYLQVPVSNGQSYWIRVSGANGSTGDFQLVLAGPDCAYDADCNDNGVLDECEPDCNHNGRPDDCDIADGISQDDDGNGIPDECQILGDLNCDQSVNAFDIDPFALALSDPDGYATAFPECDRMNADINGDGALNSFDIDPFVVLLTGG